MHGTTTGALGYAAFCAAWLALELQSGKALGEALRSWWLEPAVATLSFAVSIAIFDKKERDMGLTEEGRISTLRPGPGFIAPGSVNMLMAAGVLYWAGILVWVRLVPAVKDVPDGRPAGFQGALYLLLEVCAGIWGYDFIFFFVHVAAHHLGWESHEYHHSKKLDMRARDVLTHSPSDGALQVLVNIIVQRHTPWGAAKSRLARIVHNVAVVWMLTESHSASPAPNIARRLFSGVRRHRAHHLGAPYYQQFFGYLDDFHIRLLSARRSNGCDRAAGPVTQAARAEARPAAGQGGAPVLLSARRSHGRGAVEDRGAGPAKQASPAAGQGRRLVRQLGRAGHAER